MLHTSSAAFNNHSSSTRPGRRLCSVLQAGTREVGWSRGDTPEHVLKIVTVQTLRFIEKVDGNPRLHFWGSCQAWALLP